MILIFYHLVMAYFLGHPVDHVQFCVHL